MYKKLELLGHKHGDPSYKITSYYSWPLGVSETEFVKIISGFQKAFMLLELRATKRNLRKPTVLIQWQDSSAGRAAV